MTDTTTPTNPYEAPLDAQQAARAAALNVAQSVLIGQGSPFGTPNGRAPAELIEVAEYIVAGKPAPKVAEPVGTAWVDITPDLSGFMADIREASQKAAADSKFLRCENPDCPCNQEAPAEKAEPDATPAAADEPNPIHDNLADALAAAGERRRQKRAERAAVKAAR